MFLSSCVFFFLIDLQTGTKSSSKNLDITLMYSIIRNLWKGAIPQNGWGKDPMGNHIETADDIERIRHYRNFICHSDDSGIDTNVFNFSCLDLSRVIYTDVKVKGNILILFTLLVSIERISNDISQK